MLTDCRRTGTDPARVVLAHAVQAVVRNETDRSSTTAELWRLARGQEHLLRVALARVRSADRDRPSTVHLRIEMLLEEALGRAADEALDGLRNVGA